MILQQQPKWTGSCGAQRHDESRTAKACKGRWLKFSVFLPLCLCVLSGSPLHSFAASPEENAVAELASFTIAPGFEVSLFASEKEGVIKPIQIRFDALGRVWVIGSTVYPQLEPGEIVEWVKKVANGGLPPRTPRHEEVRTIKQ